MGQLLEISDWCGNCLDDTFFSSKATFVFGPLTFFSGERSLYPQFSGWFYFFTEVPDWWKRRARKSLFSRCVL